MGTATLTIRLDAIVQNWRALDARSAPGVQTAAVVKADGYGLGAGPVATALAKAGARSFFVAVAEEGAVLRRVLGPGPEIAVFSGHMDGDTGAIREAGLIPLLNSPEQVTRHMDALPGAPFGLQLDSGMNRLGLEPADFAALKDRALAAAPWLVMSHLACADDPAHPQNAAQLAAFRDMTDGLGLRRSLAATGGILLGEAYHFDMTRPGIGLYGGLPFATALQAAELEIPVIQCRDVAPGESVGYGAAFVAARPTRLATLSAGYADGLIRALSGGAVLHAGGVPCPLAGRVSMDLLTVDVTDYVAAQGADPAALQILGPYQGVDVLAEAAGTIGYEILTSLGARYARRHAEAPPA
ncbi:alanine racemase [Meridianimarinicoccus roseus]|uniref:Alanine racemase n=1 Tax=Meridianimarinicoccus roseus TaxID=2072018 RepID=A0A2V2L741_9RHOB|nr:alanine racemase [Meridianimarinicoccus roseus]PWR00915.1 alanine racemase [Meridianimarinicoccus roseus]